jgi:hypothetical protein
VRRVVQNVTNDLGKCSAGGPEVAAHRPADAVLALSRLAAKRSTAAVLDTATVDVIFAAARRSDTWQRK